MAQTQPTLTAVGNERRTAQQIAKDTLRTAILNGTLVAGTKLIQKDLAAQLGLSTTPIREALRALAAEGLVRFDPHTGAVVRAVDLRELVEIYEIRKALEPLALRKAIRSMKEGDLARAEALQGLMDVETEPVAWTRLNHQFHSTLDEAADSPVLLSMVKSVQDIASMYVARSLKADAERLRSGNAEHHRILDAIRAVDEDRAADELVRHLDATLASLLG